jgi:hypothetical protein
MILRLDPPIPLFVPGRGTGVAHFLVDYGPEWHLHWVVFLDDGGGVWTLANPEVRGQVNTTLGRTKCSPPKQDQSQSESLATS